MRTNGAIGPARRFKVRDSLGLVMEDRVCDLNGHGVSPDIQYMSEDRLSQVHTSRPAYRIPSHLINGALIALGRPEKDWL